MQELNDQSLTTLSSYLAPSLIDSLLKQKPDSPLRSLEEHFPAAVLFADISGFTPLTETLAQKSAEGPEELTRLLNRYFSKMIDIAQTFGGEVVQFSGDALTVVFKARKSPLTEAIVQADEAAKAMQAAMTEFEAIPSSIGQIHLGMKICIGAGIIYAMQIGGIDDRWQYLIGGDPLRQISSLEKTVEKGGIGRSQQVQNSLKNPLLKTDNKPSPSPTIEQLQQIAQSIHCFVPKAIGDYIQEQMQAWLAELRNMSILFIRVQGIHYNSPQTIHQLHSVLQLVQEIVFTYDGMIDKVTVDNDTTILMVLYGVPPFAYTDTAKRALHSALSLQKKTAINKAKKPLQLSFGIASGRVFSGPVGGDARRSYTVIGDAVNLAARLLSIAPTNSIYCDENSYQQARNYLSFSTLEAIPIKGKKAPINVYQALDLLAEPLLPSSNEKKTSLVGREKELVFIKTQLQSLQEGKNKMVVIEGEAGIGKTRLSLELLQLAQEQDYYCLSGAGQSIEKHTSYRAWRDVFTAFFELQDSQAATIKQAHITQIVRSICPDEIHRLPLLNDLFHLDFPEDLSIQKLTANLRQQGLFILLLSLLREQARKKPLVLLIEDAHWLDQLSWALLQRFCLIVEHNPHPIMVVIAARPLDTKGDNYNYYKRIIQLKKTEILPLKDLSHKAIVELITHRLGLQKTADLPLSIVQLLKEWVHGNPFFAEELIFTLRDQQILQLTPKGAYQSCTIIGDLAAAAQALPNTIEGLIMERIDRLSPKEKLILRVGSVIGRSFYFTTIFYTLYQHLPIEEEQLQDYLEQLNKLDLTPLEAPPPNLSYLFKHIYTQEVAYQSLLFAQRRALHQTVAEWYLLHHGNGYKLDSQHELPSSLLPYLHLLTHHYRLAENKMYQRHFAQLAGIEAAQKYANEEALKYLQEALALYHETDVEDRYNIHQQLESIYGLIGNKTAQQTHLEALNQITLVLDDPKKRTTLLLKKVAYHIQQSDIDIVHQLCKEVLVLAQTHSFKNTHIKTKRFIAEAYLLQGKLEEAETYLLQTLEEAQKDTSEETKLTLYSSLGRLHQQKGEWDTSANYYDKALDIARSTADKRQEGVLLNNFGVLALNEVNYQQSRAYYAQALQIDREIGDRIGESKLLNNLGNSFQEQGLYEEAKDHHYKALQINRETNRRVGECIVLLGLGITYEKEKNYSKALELQKISLQISQELGLKAIQGYAFHNLANAQIGIGNLDKAAHHYSQALHLRQETKQQHMIMETLGGMAKVDLLQGNLDKALAKVRDIQQYMKVRKTNVTIRNMIVCYQVLYIHDQPEAIDILNNAHQMIMRKINNIQDIQTKERLLLDITDYNWVLTEKKRWEQEEKDFLRLKAFLLQELQEKLSSKLYYHSLHHTLDVYQSTCQLAILEKCLPADILLVKTAALLHDFGFIYNRTNHEFIGCDVAQKILPEYGYSNTQIDIICGIILSTQLPHQPKTPLQELLCDADVDYLGRADFFEIAQHLYKELVTAGELVANEQEWNEMQLRFLKQHQYFTDSAKRLRMTQKQVHILEIEKMEQ